MSVPSSELQKRVITGLIGGTALLGAVIYGGWLGICVLTALLSLAMVNEFCGITLTSADHVAKKYGLLLLVWIISVVNAITPHYEYELLTFCFLTLFAGFLFAAKGKEGDEFLHHFKELEYSVFGLIYLTFLPLYLTRIHGGPSGVHWTVLFLLVVWAGDTLAYFVGKKYGRRKLYPHISPKKTVEGGVGGLLGGVFFASVYKLLFFKSLSWGAVFFVPLLVGAVAQVGDLCESFLKRVYGKKDSGQVLPGHGGFLDRFDGVVFSVPVMYACTRIFT